MAAIERLGLVGTERQHVSQPRAVFLTGRGCELLGRPRRRPPRAEVQREHEAAIVWLVTELERETEPDVRVLTERECRRLEAAGADRYSVPVTGGRDTRRWPDVVIEGPEGRRAIEIEFAPKGTDRLRRIVDGYALASPYVFMVKAAALGKRIQRLASQRPSLPAQLNVTLPSVSVMPWTGLDDPQRAALARARSTDLLLAPRATGRPAIEQDG